MTLFPSLCSCDSKKKKKTTYKCDISFPTVDMKQGGFTWGIHMALNLSDVPGQQKFQHVCSWCQKASQISAHKRTFCKGKAAQESNGVWNLQITILCPRIWSRCVSDRREEIKRGSRLSRSEARLEAPSQVTHSMDKRRQASGRKLTDTDLHTWPQARTHTYLHTQTHTHSYTIYVYIYKQLAFAIQPVLLWALRVPAPPPPQPCRSAVESEWGI